MIYVGCSRTGCEEVVDVGRETDWSAMGQFGNPFVELDYGPTIAVALPEGWAIDTVSTGDEVIHCPDHAF